MILKVRQLTVDKATDELQLQNGQICAVPTSNVPRSEQSKMAAVRSVTFYFLTHSIHSELRKVLFLAMGFLFVYEISLELLNGFAPNSHGTSLKVKGQGHQG